jgi:hypothetical protein
MDIKPPIEAGEVPKKEAAVAVPGVSKVSPVANKLPPSVLDGVGPSERFFFFFNLLRLSWSKWQNLHW